MKQVIVFCLIALVFGAQASIQVQRDTAKVSGSSSLCPTCVSFMAQSLNELISIAANSGVVGGCGELCSYLPNELEATVCSLICDYVGIDALLKALTAADPDPIWICEEIDLCPINDYAAGKITSFTVNPKSGPQGTTFTFTIVYQIVNTTGTGQLEFDVFPADANPFGEDALLVSVGPGTYQAQVSLEATPSESEPFTPGAYKTLALLCEGACGSSHSHSFVMDQKQGMFTITSSN